MSEPAFPGRLSHEDPDLSERQRQVFAALLTLHGRSARPIGSETLAQLAGIPLSPASIRYALAALDEEVLSRLDLAPLGERKALMVFDLGGGAVLTLVLELESPLERQELEEVAGVLRERLLGRPMAEVRARLGSDPELVRKSAVRL